MLACSFVGTGPEVADRLHGFVAQTAADELIVAAAIYDHGARLRSYEILARAMA
jgi:alkanesulfonate monooxygenase SsuD/methylene tetrahydromethanopterin reductase-like flavin-dependent oxidoreductase (luciferase family)